MYVCVDRVRRASNNNDDHYDYHDHHHDYDNNYHGRTNYDYDAVFMYWKCRMVVL